MTVVAVMSQPMRADYLVSYLTRSGSTSPIALLSPEASRSAAHLPTNVRVQIIDPTGSNISRGVAGAARRMRTGFASWADSGSSGARFWGDIARRAEQRISRLVDRLRDRFPRRASRRGPTDPVADPIFRALRDINERAAISTIVVFDLFDLPSALAFSSLNDVIVLVR